MSATALAGRSLFSLAFAAALVLPAFGQGAAEAGAAEEFPVPPVDGYDLNVASKLFRESCASCHGKDGKARTAALKALRIPRERLDLTAPEAVRKDIEALFGRIKRGAGKMPPYGALPGFERKLSDDQVLALVRYIKRGLKTAPVAPGPVPEGGSLEKGLALYESSCAACHGPDGRGRPMAAAHLGVAPAALDLFAKELFGMGEEKVAALVRKGKGRMAAPLPDARPEQLSSLHHYLHCLTPSAP